VSSETRACCGFGCLPTTTDGRDALSGSLLNDGQNLFEAATSFAGVHWQVGETATRLIAEKKIRPLIIVGIDKHGRSRMREFIPYKSRDPRVLHPAGHCYPEFLQSEVMPLIEERSPFSAGRKTLGWAALRWAA